jgi:hypothetical protein
MIGFPKICLHIFAFLTISFAIDHRMSGELKTATTVGMNVLRPSNESSCRICNDKTEDNYFAEE